MAKRKSLPRTRCSGEWTEGKYWSFLRGGIRRMSMRWKPIRDAKLRARRPYAGPNKRQKFEYLCEACGGWFSDKETQVDHKIPAGSLTSYEDVGPFIERLFCEVDDLRVMCKGCHNVETNNQSKAAKSSSECSSKIQPAKKPAKRNAKDATIDPEWDDVDGVQLR